MDKTYQISFLMVTFNSYPFIKKSIEAIIKNIKNIQYEIIIVDNNSNDETINYLQSLKNENIKTVFLKQNSGFSAGMNTASLFAQYENIVIFNNDIYLEDNAEKNFFEMLDLLNNNSNIGIISPLFKKEDGTYDINFNTQDGILRSVFYRFYKMFAQDAKTPEINKLSSDSSGCADVFALSGQFIMIKKNLFNLVGGFDERYFLYTSDWDLCTKVIKRGFRCVIYPNAVFIHALSQSNSKKRFFSTYDLYRSFAQYIIKWKIAPILKESFFRILFYIPTQAEILIRNLINKKNVSD